MSVVTSKKILYLFLLGIRQECQSSDRLVAEPHGCVVVRPTLAAQNSDLLVPYPHALMGVTLAVKGEASAHHYPATISLCLYRKLYSHSQKEVPSDIVNSRPWKILWTMAHPSQRYGTFNPLRKQYTDYR